MIVCCIAEWSLAYPADCVVVAILHYIVNCWRFSLPTTTATAHSALPVLWTTLSKVSAWSTVCLRWSSLLLECVCWSVRWVSPHFMSLYHLYLSHFTRSISLCTPPLIQCFFSNTDQSHRWLFAALPSRHWLPVCGGLFLLYIDCKLPAVSTSTDHCHRSQCTVCHRFSKLNAWCSLCCDSKSYWLTGRCACTSGYGELHCMCRETYISMP